MQWSSLYYHYIHSEQSSTLFDWRPLSMTIYVEYYIYSFVIDEGISFNRNNASIIVCALFILICKKNFKIVGTFHFKYQHCCGVFHFIKLDIGLVFGSFFH